MDGRMIKDQTSHPPEAVEIWHTVQDALRKLRGQNRWRGLEEHYIDRLEIRLFAEPRGSRLSPTWWKLQLGNSLESALASSFPGGKILRVADFGGDWEAWLAAIVDQCRGSAYIHTQSDRADYRAAFLQTEQALHASQNTHLSEGK
jgi:hypothetical protein